MKQRITRKNLDEFWEKMGNNELVLTFYPTKEDYWKECQRINNLPEDKWQKLMNENLKKLLKY